MGEVYLIILFIFLKKAFSRFNASFQYKHTKPLKKFEYPLFMLLFFLRFFQPAYVTSKFL